MISYYASSNGTGDGLTASTPCSLTTVKGMVQAISSTDDVTVWLMDGRYQQNSTLTFGAADSGTNGYQVYWRAYSGTPVISGGVDISHGVNGVTWSIHDSNNNVWKAVIPDALIPSGLLGNRISVDGRLVDPVTWLLENVSYSPYAYTATVPNANLPAVDFTSPWHCFLTKWAMYVLSASHSKGSTLTTFTFNTWTIDYIEADGVWSGGLDYHAYLSGDKAFFTSASAGCCAYDRTTKTVYYKPLNTETITSLTIILPLLETVVSFNGADNIHFDGITFAHSAYWHNNDWQQVQANTYYNIGDIPYTVEGVPDYANGNVKSITYGVTLSNCNNVHIINGSVEQMGNGGLEVRTNCHNITIHKNTIKNISGNGVSLGFVIPLTGLKYTVCTDIIFENNIIDTVGTEYWGGVGVNIGYVTGFTVLHNEFRRCPYSPIHFWCDDLTDYLSPNSGEIAYNYIHDTNYLEHLQDGGRIYCRGYLGGVTIHDNYFGVSQYSLSDYWGIGLYFDELAARYTCYNNVVAVPINPPYPEYNEITGEGVWHGVWGSFNYKEEVHEGECTVYDNYAAHLEGWGGVGDWAPPSSPTMSIEYPTLLGITDYTQFPELAKNIAIIAMQGIIVDGLVISSTFTSADLVGVLGIDDMSVSTSFTEAMFMIVEVSDIVCTTSFTEALLQTSGSIRSPTDEAVQIVDWEGNSINIIVI